MTRNVSRVSAECESSPTYTNSLVQNKIHQKKKATEEGKEKVLAKKRVERPEEVRPELIAGTDPLCKAVRLSVRFPVCLSVTLSASLSPRPS